MTDYGHELEFGVFLTPAADQLGGLLQNAQLAEVLGLDLVTLQDHPYQAKFADPWTLLSELGARTTSVRLTPNVASLPLRPPVMLAKAAATLDVLTGGRVELALGAGAFWDAIEAAGGTRRTPREAVDALAEAIALIRQFWAGGTVRFEGAHYRAKGLHAGPPPAHPIPIWVGAYGPRMVRLTGELADGWVPSMGYADPPALPDLNARLDEAAIAAGRGPEQVRRIYNVFGSFGTGGGFLRGTPADWAEQLAGLTLDQGISTYVLGTDDPDTIRRFAEEVVPATREQVAAARERPPHRPSGWSRRPRTTAGGWARCRGTRAAGRRMRSRRGRPTRRSSRRRPSTWSTSMTACARSWPRSATSWTRCGAGTSRSARPAR
jgi:alkanesulfonate monooxygenase SsuD/methylene tetrahydromethanopterin reductase-like flavin-dependent oxidoreductase (luciferase family)